jgi:hypothetical protein
VYTENEESEEIDDEEREESTRVSNGEIHLELIDSRKAHFA